MVLKNFIKMLKRKNPLQIEFGPEHKNVMDDIEDDDDIKQSPCHHPA